MIELWRNLAYVGFCSVAQPPKLYGISSLVWMGDFFPCTYTPYILIPCLLYTSIEGAAKGKSMLLY